MLISGSPPVKLGRSIFSSLATRYRLQRDSPHGHGSQPPTTHHSPLTLLPPTPPTPPSQPTAPVRTPAAPSSRWPDPGSRSVTPSCNRTSPPAVPGRRSP